VLELGRSCVDSAYRTKMTMQLLWRGIAGYVFTHNIDLLFGCASLPGVNPEALAVPLSYLYHKHLAPADLRPRALPELYTDMNLLPAAAINARQALAELPPLVKGYLRLGGFVGDGAVIDRQFNTTDVCVIVKTDLITDKYFRHYDRTASRNL
jgi:putative hemolysin